MNPLAEHPKQIDKSPYAYAWNSPIKHTDPDGELPVPVIGFLVGAITDVAIQSIEIALDNNKSFSNDFSGSSVVVSGLAGATGAGLATKVGKLGRVAKLAVEVTHDMAASAAGQYAKDGKVSAKAVVIDATVGKAIGDAAGKVAGKAASNSREGKVLTNQLDRAKRVAGDNPRPGRAKAVQEAKSRKDGHTESRATAASTSSSGVGSNVVNKILEDDKKKKQ